MDPKKWLFLPLAHQGFCNFNLIFLKLQWHQDHLGQAKVQTQTSSISFPVSLFLLFTYCIFCLINSLSVICKALVIA